MYLMPGWKEEITGWGYYRGLFLRSNNCEILPAKLNDIDLSESINKFCNIPSFEEFLLI